VDYKIEAPFDGIVTGLDIEVGDSISRDEILASIITKKLQAEISLNEIDAVKVKKGSKAILIFDAIGEQEFEGEVSKIDTIGNVSSGVVSYDVVISFETSSELLKPGMSVEVNIEIDKAEDVLIISNSMINKKGDGSEYASVILGGNENNSESKTIKKTIKTGITDDIYAEVLSGLEEGDLITSQTSVKQSATTTKNTETKSIMPMGGGGKPRD
jgi:multidrug efflux pump subunit AcrA (membrane-fusion protein)